MPFENLLNISVKKDWIDYLSALLTPTIAIAGLYIVFNQKRIEESRLRHELFERRYRQFKEVQEFVHLIALHQTMTNEDEIRFLSEIADMKFIFNEEIATYVKKSIWNVACEFHAVYKTFNENSSQQERKRNFDNQLKLREKLQQNLDIFEKKTLKYMQLQQTGTLKYLSKYLITCYERIKNQLVIFIIAKVEISATSNGKTKNE